MKVCTLYFIRKVSLVMTFLSLTCISYGAIFTATSSGNFSSSATWMGGFVPPSMLSLDEIVIPAGVQVTLDQNLTINGALAQLSVIGSLTSSGDISLTLDQGTIIGTGNITVGTAEFHTGTGFLFAGTLTADVLNVASDMLATADILVNETLHLAEGTLTLLSGGSLDLSSEGTIVIDGGIISVGGGGSVGLSTDYNVMYIHQSSIAGLELTGEGLQDVIVNVSTGNHVLLTSDLTVEGTLALTAGALWMGANDLTVNGNLTSTAEGSIYSTATSDVSINFNGSMSGVLNFAEGSAVNNFTVDVGASGEANIGGNLIVNGNLQLASGILDFANTSLEVNGNISGDGSLSSNSNSSLSLNVTGGLATELQFASTGDVIGDLMIDVGAGNAVSLGSDLTIEGTIGFQGGSELDLNGYELSLGSESSVNGTFSLIVDASSDLAINASAGISSLVMEGVIGNLTVNTNEDGNVALGANAIVAGILDLQEGTLDLNGYDLTVNGNIAANGEGTISSTALSDIIVETSASVDGALNFTAEGNTAGNLIVNIGGEGAVSLGTDLTVADAVQLIEGYLDIEDNTLSLDELATIIGGDAASYIVTQAGGLIETFMDDDANSLMNFPIGTLQEYAPAIVSFNQGSANGQVSVGVVSNVMSEGTFGVDLSETEDVVDATWNVHSDISVGLDMNLEVMWSEALEANDFDRTDVYLSHYVGSDWDVNTSAEASSEANGMYSLERTGITSLSPFAVFDAHSVTAVDDLDDHLIRVFPNPVTDQLTVQNQLNEDEPLHIQILNANGQLLGQFELKEPTSTISFNEFAQGNYLIKFTSGEKQRNRQITKL